MASLLTVTGLSKSFGAAKALDDVSLSLEAGEVHALMGENGAGKSTLIKCLAGVEKPDAGSIRLRDRDLSISDAPDALAAGFRFIHQELNVVGHLSVAENLFLGKPYPKRFGLIDWTELHRRTQDTLDLLSINWIDPRVKLYRLKPGDQMLVKIASAFLGQKGAEPVLYVMDEPTAALNDRECERLFSIIGKLKARGAAILYVSHRMDEVMTLSDRVTVLRDGRPVATRVTRQTDAATLIEDMTGRNLEQAYPHALALPSSDLALEIRDLAADGLAPTRLGLHRGEIVGVAGLAGSGQSEFLEALIGARKARGSLSMPGRDGFLNPDPAEAWKNGFAYVPKERRSGGIVGPASIVANVVLSHLAALSRLMVFANAKAERGMTATLAANVRLKHAALSQPVRQLSGGNQQKVVFARAIAGMPTVLLLDEPTRGVDVGAKFDIYSLIRSLSGSGMAVLMASSDLPELIGLCDRIAIMAEGDIRMIIPTTGLDQAGLLAQIYQCQSAASTAGDRPSRAGAA